VIWPVFLICAGILLILRRYESRNRWENPPTPGPPPGIPQWSPSGTPPQQPVETPPAPSSPPGTTSATTDAPPTGARADAPPTSAPSWTQSNFAQGSGPGPGPGPGWQGGSSWDHFHRRMDEISDNIHKSWDDGGRWSNSSAPHLNEVNIFWGGKRRIVAKNFVGGDVVAIFGGFEIDLREADILGNVAEIEVVTIFGGGEIRVPPNWEVVLETVGIFGGSDDRTRHPDFPNPGAPTATGSAAPQPKRLIVKGVAIFGGLGIKN